MAEIRAVWVDFESCGMAHQPPSSTGIRVLQSHESLELACVEMKIARVGLCRDEEPGKGTRTLSLHVAATIVSDRAETHDVGSDFKRSENWPERPLDTDTEKNWLKCHFVSIGGWHPLMAPGGTGKPGD